MANTTSSDLSSNGVNYTTTVKAETIVPFGEEDSAFFPGLTKAEEVIAWAGITVAILGVSAILLRLIMPLVRRKCRKDKGDNAMKNAHLRGSSG
ncbi:hypothetical protein V1264_005392 [Littorina saxatilis]|uniref:Uncharacterized protein n=2 Tax=Littorina saxatilis TaxID=31220 RepID=A0AAN9G5E3_9CAEN